MADEDIGVKFAVLEERVHGLREQQKAHADTMNRELSAINANLKILTSAFERSKGAWWLILAMSGLFGAAVSKVVAISIGAVTK